MLKLEPRSETLQNGETIRNNTTAYLVVELPVKKSVIAIPGIIIRNICDYILLNSSKVKLFNGNIKQNWLYTKNNLVIKVRYTVEFGGPESSVSIYWKIRERVLKHFVRGWVGGWMSERNSAGVTELVNESECRDEWMNMKVCW